MSDGSGGDLFIVDNSVSGWTGLEYLRQWSDLARSFDIATGFFEIGALLALDGKWQQLDKIRLLMGDEVSLRTLKAFEKALAKRVDHFANSLEREKEQNPFLEGVEAVVEAIAAGKIECRVYRRDKFHAKAYITHAKFDVVGAQALVGSSNFTRAGLTKNIELNIQVQSGREVTQLQDWFEAHWVEAEDVTAEILHTVTRHTAEFTPFDVYAKALYELFRGRELTAGEWDQTRSRMFPQLDRYQQEAYGSLMKIARRHGGAFLCDGVGLGKTFVGLMLIERLVLHENKRVVLFAPKAARKGVWDPHLREWLPHIGGVGGGEDFSSLSVFNHTDLSRGKEFPERFKRITELADAVIVDEAHHFRNRGSQGSRHMAADTEGVQDGRSRYWRLYDMLDEAQRSKLVFLLTATPINNRLADFRHMAELFTRGEEAYFAGSLGVNNLSAHFNQKEHALREYLAESRTGSADMATGLVDGMTPEAQEALADDVVFGALVVQRSRSYARASQMQEIGQSAAFPQRERPQVADYTIRKQYQRVLDMFEEACNREHPLFSLAIYYPLAHYTGSEEVDAFEKNRQRQVVGLIRTMFLKRFESSVYAFEKSLDRLMRKLLAFVRANSEPGAELDRYNHWRQQHKKIVNYRPETQLSLALGDMEDEENEDDADADEDVIPPEMLEAVEVLPRNEYDLETILEQTFDDLDEIAKFLEVTRRLTPTQDDKVQKLVRLLRSNQLAGLKVLVFTEFADTARYVENELKAAEIEGLERIDSGSTLNRTEAIRRFSPYYNGSSTAELARAGQTEIQVLVSTDVLSEGLNLQDATRLINYDLHWNPVRLMQRIGRVDRRMNSEIEARLVTDHPEAAKDRGAVRFWNFLPPDELERILNLYERVSGKTLLISETLGIEGRKLLHPDDDYDELREFNAKYEGKRSAIEEMQLEYQALLKAHPGLSERLEGFPGSVFSGSRKLSKGTRGVFFCYSLPAMDTSVGEFTLEAGPTRWYLYDLTNDTIADSPGEIADSIRSNPNTPRRCTMSRSTLKEVRKKVLHHVRNTYLKQVQAPGDAPKPKLHCWMELN
ncbi:helicase-related protein [Candidatus Poriferisocius sp.]|uniref:helicase-related protein n=1 Tax=Candidatus Poriferisocius sp. TaxID=3101276 RepID=UPI003B01F16D